MADSPFSKKELEELLGAQTDTILEAVDERLRGFRFEVNARFDKVDARLANLEEKMERLVTTLDAFLKRLTTLEDEFEAVKYELNRVKTFLKEKMGFEPE
ncbi:MAG: hypothetical protein A2806_00390 [Candidatus Terrybacteria bacterium RIFCSPHIGHO2_01_FULL_48_17]|uniref:Uncharacterized protein n=1 Tax=Candidatus Terrybacteria bacterium RIFCSPHIGHO2_01_FULL_48_17 TaxID=1802362 RepID=A0A1G2PJU5_9BACT|nr:MAG: hypothetical protein A2806_00390 [Candidatus Terrybacteria bacterium RIFCSPHIGHO2_01_FULL_48_17]OHA53672.1 MAG: hypothetical protein A3A30_00710 [Candidatus Terrybacteria bacterium RIFCSPLOWO2_01_FULL_48_14]